MTAAPDWVALLEKVLAGAPSLPGAACLNDWQTWDAPEAAEDPADAAARMADAAERCVRDCPAFTRCAEWNASLSPGRRPIGVVAGQINLPKQPKPAGRPRKQAS